MTFNLEKALKNDGKCKVRVAKSNKTYDAQIVDIRMLGSHSNVVICQKLDEIYRCNDGGFIRDAAMDKVENVPDVFAVWVTLYRDVDIDDTLRSTVHTAEEHYFKHLANIQKIGGTIVSTRRTQMVEGDHNGFTVNL